jgi:hypothetical protein
MFHLEQSIAVWRRQMLAAGIKAPVPLDELENHLREEIELQLKSGFTGQQAFEIAAGKIGQVNSLEQEFKKINCTDKAQLRRRAGFAFAAILGFYSLIFVRLLIKNDLTSSERLLGLASVATTLLTVFVVWQIMPRFFPVVANRAVQSAIGIVGGISGMGWIIAFACFILPRFDFTQGQLLVAVSWALVPALVLPTTAFLVLDKSERQQFKTPSS